MTLRSDSIAVIVNPVTAEDEARELTRLLDERDVAVRWIETTEDDPGSGKTRQAVEAGAGLVIACGGDGTVRACIESLVGTDTTLAIIPAGTGNLLARNLGIPEEPEEALRVALEGDTRQIDVGFVNGEAFAVMAGAGFDAEIMTDTDRKAKERFGALAYVGTALRHLRDKPVKAVANVDGGPVFAGYVSTVMAANFGGLQGGIEVAPDAVADDGRLEFMAVRAWTVASWIRAGIAVLTRRDRNGPIDRWSATHGEITLSEPTPYELDGDERDPVTRLEFTVSPKALRVRAPEEKR